MSDQEQRPAGAPDIEAANVGAADGAADRAADARSARRPDYLEGFLGAPVGGAAVGGATVEGATVEGGAAQGAGSGDVREDVVAALRGIYDPEIPVNIYDLGLIYGIEVDEGHVVVTMTLTTPHCPVAESMPGEVETRVGLVPGVASTEVNLVWDPPWQPQNMSEEAKLELGLL